MSEPIRLARPDVGQAELEAIAEVVGTGHECRRLLVQAATVPHQHQGRVIGPGYG